MLYLLLLRHAKADQPADLADHERPLSIVGHKQARQIGKYIQSRQLEPDLVLISSARRTRETWAEASDAGQLDSIALVESRIYEASVDDLLDVIGKQDAKHRRLMLVGHNPGMDRLTTWLTGSAYDKALANRQKGFGVGSLAVIALPASNWPELKAQSGRLEHFTTPDALVH